MTTECNRQNAAKAAEGATEKSRRVGIDYSSPLVASYHKRSNVESTFSAIKRKFGDAVMSKTDTAMVNEVLCKLLCHNLTCLIQEQETLGIAPIFWKDEEAADPSVLPMRRIGAVLV